MILTTEAEAHAWLAQLPEWDGAARERLELLEQLLRAENQRQNLVAATSLESLWLRHIADSAQLLTHVPRETGSPWLDLGTGAGFPGLVIAALRPECRVVMVESRARRAEWLKTARDALHLDQAEVFGGQLEQFGQRREGSCRNDAEFLRWQSFKLTAKDLCLIQVQGVARSFEPFRSPRP